MSDNTIVLVNPTNIYVGLPPELKGDPKESHRRLMINSHLFYVEPNGGIFLDKVGIALKLAQRGDRFIVYAHPDKIKACSRIDPSSYVFDEKTKELIGFRNPLQIMENRTGEMRERLARPDGGVVSVDRVKELEKKAAAYDSLAEENARLKKQYDEMLKERQESKEEIAMLKAGKAINVVRGK